MLLNRQKILKDVWPVPTTVDIYPWPNYPNTFAWDNKAIADEFSQYRDYNPKMAARAPGPARDQKGIGGQPAVQGQTGHDEHHHTHPARRPGYIVGQLLVEELQELGISSSLRSPTSAVYSSLVESGNWDIRSEWLGYTILDPWQGYQQYDSQYFEPIGTNALTFDQMRLKEPAFDATIAKLGGENPTAADHRPHLQRSAAAVLHLPARDPLPADGLLARHQHPVLDGLAYKQEPVPDTQQLVGTIPLRHRQAEARYHVTNR